MSTIIIKNSGTADSVPTAGQLADGELAINRADGKIYMKTISDGVIDIVAHTAVTEQYSETYKIAGVDKILTTTDAIVDSVIYDTSLDSDGGAWRFKEKSWSTEVVPSGTYVGEFADVTAAITAGGATNDWYQLTTGTQFFRIDAEGQTEIFRAGRSEFPAKALVLAEADKVVIYDLTTTEPEMWMVFDSPTNNIYYLGYLTKTRPLSSITMMEGQLAAGGSVNGYFRLIDFTHDTGYQIYTNATVGTHQETNNIATRNSVSVMTKISDVHLVSGGINDVAMTVLPDAPVDSVTGLHVPTIAVATNAGVSVITHDGDVFDITGSNNTSIEFIENRVFISRTGDDATEFGQVPLADIAGWIWREGYYAGTGAGSLDTIDTSISPKLSQNAIGQAAGLNIFKENFDDFSEGMIAYTTKDYATGWMVGDIKSSFLSSSDETDLVGSGQLIDEGTFLHADGILTGAVLAAWGTGTNATLTIDTNRLKILNSTTANGRAFQSFTTVEGETYTITAEHTDGTSTIASKVGTTENGNEYGDFASGTGVKSLTFVATGTTAYITFRNDSAVSGEFAFVDNASCKLADLDRSVNGNGIQVNGTLTRTLMDTNSELVAYSGFSASNYLEQPHNSDLEFGTGDFYFGMWMKMNPNTGDDTLFDLADPESNDTARIVGYFTAPGTLHMHVRSTAPTSHNLATTSAYDDSQWHFVEFSRSGDSAYIHVDGIEVASNDTFSTVDTTYTSSILTVGTNIGGAAPMVDGSLALFRVSATLPTDEQRAHIYETERQMIVNKCLLDPASSDSAITALDYNEKRGILSAATSWGRHDFDNLVRVGSEATAVGSLTSISADGDRMFQGGATGSDILLPEVDLRAHLVDMPVENNILTDDNKLDLSIPKVPQDGGEFTGEITVPNIILKGADQIISGVNVVDHMIYDATQDSDGGAWRYSEKSWFDEAVPTGKFLGRFATGEAAYAAGGVNGDWYQSTATGNFAELYDDNNAFVIYRAGRQEFPALSLIVAEAARVIIYDLTDSEPSMWMVFTSANAVWTHIGYSLDFRPLTSISMTEGVLCTGSATSGWMNRINFAKDLTQVYRTSGFQQFTGGISTRNESITAVNLPTIDTSISLVHDNVNDVAMTILPDAPTDSDTGLKVPTIAVATDNGISVITDDGPVYDIASDSTVLGALVIDFYSENLVVGWNTIGATNRHTYTYRLPTADTTANGTFKITNFGDYTTTGVDLHYAYGAVTEVSKSGNDSVAFGNLVGITNVRENFDTPAEGMVAYTTKDYATGWMVSDIRGCLLADSNVGSIVGSELVTNGTFDTVTTGWSTTNATLAVVGNELEVTNTAAYGLAYQSLTTVVGETYVLTGTSRRGTTDRVLIVSGASQTWKYNTSNESFTMTFIATSTSSLVELANGATLGTGYFDNISCRLAVEDRSVKGNGAQVYGTVTKSLIDTDSELVAYSGFTNDNYIEQPVNTDLDFGAWDSVPNSGVGDFYFGMWLKMNPNTNPEMIFVRGDYNAGWNGSIIQIYVNADGYLVAYISDDGAVSGDSLTTTNTIDDGQYHFVEMYRTGTLVYVLVDGVNWGSLTLANAIGSLSSTTATLRIGINASGGDPLINGSLALFRASATVPTDEQRAHIYATERAMIKNPCLIDGDSNAVTALDFNEKRNELSVGTSWGRTDFDNLVRIHSVASTVGAITSLAADGDIVINGGASGSRITAPDIDVRAEMVEQFIKGDDLEWKDVTFENGWVNYDGGYTVAQYRKIGDVVELRGMIKNGTLDTIGFTLPVGYRPTGLEVHAATSNGALGVARSAADGGVTIVSGSTTWFNLAHISFSIS